MTQPSPDRTVVLDSWRQLRESGRLGTLLPQCIDRSWGEGPDAYGFVTVDYRVHRDFPLMPSPADGSAGSADLLELYWSVRTKAGRQDTNWAAGLNAHVIQVVSEPVAVEHLDRLFGLVVTLRRALQLGGTGQLVAAGASVALHVRGLLLGLELSAPVAIVERLASHADVPLIVGRYTVDADGAPQFSGAPADSRHWESPAVAEDVLESLGRRLTQNDALFQSRGEWAPDPGHDWDDDGNIRPRKPRG